MDFNDFMNVIFVYFSHSGRTKKVAEAIASSLKDENVQLEALQFHGKLFELMAVQEAMINGDLSKLVYDEKILDVSPYDLICIGAPVYGGRPAAAFNAYVKAVKNLDGKNVVIFSTCFAMAGKCLAIMKELVESKGGLVSNQMMFKGIFRINLKKAQEFGLRLLHLA